LDNAIAALIGAAIGGAITFLSTFVDRWSQRSLERKKVEWTREHMVDAEFREHVTAVARELLSAQHSIEWLCSKTGHGQPLHSKAVDDYHAEIHSAFPKLLGALAAVSTIDGRAYKELFGLAEKIFAIDSAIASSLQSFDTSPEAASAGVAKQRHAAAALYKSLPISINKIIVDLNK
jgi:hypothetical protein